MLYTVKQASKYICDHLDGINDIKFTDLDKELIYETIFGNVLDNLKDKLTDTDKIILNNYDSDEEIEQYLYYKINGYQNIIEDITSKFMAEYVVDQVVQ